MNYPELIQEMWQKVYHLQVTLGKIPLRETVEGIQWMIAQKRIIDTEYLPTLDPLERIVVDVDLALMSKAIWRVFNHCEMVANFAGINVREIRVFGRAS